MISRSYGDWFQELLGSPPHPWQASLGDDPACRDRLIRIPTGFGKTAGVILPWAYHRLVRGDERWPRRLVFTLPMRTLVEQTAREAAGWLEKVGALGGVRADLHVLMGGVEASRWAAAPTAPALLIGTQDMLLSRALNRGFGAARGLWPMELGLLHHDALWVFDEVQLMDVGLATSAQLAAFRRANHDTALRPAASWWMSATLQPSWLATIDHAPSVEGLRRDELTIPDVGRQGGLWEVEKRLERRPETGDSRAVARLVEGEHQPATLTLVVANTVRRATEIAEALGKSRGLAAEVVLLHSRFRPAERRQLVDRYLLRGAPLPTAGRILVATQVVEAGVDLSAALLVTELAPWPSLVQRLGRLARYSGERGRAFVVGAAPESDKAAAPYQRGPCVAAAALLERLGPGADVAPRNLDRIEAELRDQEPALLESLYPYAPEHLLRRVDFEDLFDTSADLAGVDLDVSRYLRTGDERQVHLAWRDLGGAKGRSIDGEAGAPLRREELCPVPIEELREWVREGRRLYRFDYLEGQWIEARRLIPGDALLVDAGAGGYDPRLGWSPKHKTPVAAVAPTVSEDLRLLTTAGSEEDDSLSQSPWQSIAEHGGDVGNRALEIARELGLPPRLGVLLELAGRWHDVGKAHPVFQRAILEAARGAAGAVGERRDLAKAPDGAWRRPAPYGERPGFRHELASTLTLFELLRRIAPLHPALLGPQQELLALLGEPVPEAVADEAPLDDHRLARELAALAAEEVDLVAWLVCTHHGKVRCGWTSTPSDQAQGLGAIHGLVDGERFPEAAAEVAGPGGAVALPALTLSLELAGLGVGGRYGASWSDRVAALRRRHGPFVLSFLEALLRAADWRASARLNSESKP